MGSGRHLKSKKVHVNRIASNTRIPSRVIPHTCSKTKKGHKEGDRDQQDAADDE